MCAASPTEARPKTFKPVLGEVPTPLADNIGINSQARRHDLALLTVSTGKMIRARSTRACGVLRRDANDVNSTCSTSSSPGEVNR
jgi:hypothetical protein